MVKNTRPGKPAGKHKSQGAQRSHSQDTLTLLGGGSLPKIDSPNQNLLESFESPSPNDYEVSFTTEEFTSLCPVTGQPDFSSITITYTPDLRCIESKSLKHYLGAYRNMPVFAEGIANRILADIVASVSPRQLTVICDFFPRGGIGIRVEANHQSPSSNTKKIRR